MSVLALLQLGAKPPAAGMSLIALLLSSDLVTKAVLLLLVVLSLMSWAIMFAKWRAFSTAESNGRAFVHDFERARGMDDAMLLAQRAKPSAFTAVFARAVQFLGETKPAMAATPDRTARLSGSQVEALRLVLDSETSKEREELGRFIPWLATVGSVSPAHRAAGNRAWRHQRVRGYHRQGVRQHLGSGAGHCHRTRRDRGGADRRDPCSLCVQHVCCTTQSSRQRTRGIRLRADRPHGA